MATAWQRRYDASVGADCSGPLHKKFMTLANGYRDRTAAGQALAQHLTRYKNTERTLVLALPRGGVPVARPIALALSSPLDVFMVRKIGLPEVPDSAMGAIATGGVQLMDEAVIAASGISSETVDQLVRKEATELQRREAVYRGSTPPRDVSNQAIILVDDGIATGFTMRVAILALRQLNPASLTIAVPVGAPETCQLLEGLVDELVCPLQPSPFHAVGLWYDHFPRVTDEEVRESISETAEVARSRDET